MAAGGYHHHLGLNIWRGRGVPPMPAGTVGLRHWTIVLPADDAAALRERVIAAGAPYEDTPEACSCATRGTSRCWSSPQG